MVANDYSHMSENTEQWINDTHEEIRKSVLNLMKKLSDDESTRHCSSATFLMASVMRFMVKAYPDKEKCLLHTEELFKEAISVLKRHDE